jgi:addiction module HigA family antidote
MGDIKARRAPKLAPTHPGELLREDVLPALGLSVSQAARQLGVTRQALHHILAGTAAVTPEMAVRLDHFCGNGAELWLTMQATYDLHRVRQKLRGVLRKASPKNRAAIKIPRHRARAA